MKTLAAFTPTAVRCTTASSIGAFVKAYNDYATNTGSLEYSPLEADVLFDSTSDAEEFLSVCNEFKIPAFCEPLED